MQAFAFHFQEVAKKVGEVEEQTEKAEKEMQEAAKQIKALTGVFGGRAEGWRRRAKGGLVS